VAIQRREFLKTASWAALAQMAGASPLRSIAALAEKNLPAVSGSSSNYKALICIFMRGGNDSNNMVVPLESSQFSLYNKARGPLALSQSSLLSLSGISYGLHPAFTTLNQAFKEGQAALIANVGPLVEPTTVAQYRAALVPLPEALMSHQDQQQVWETGGYLSGTGPGWAGLTADRIGSTYNTNNLPMVTLLGTATNFGLGNTTAPYTVNGGSQPSTFWCSAGMSCYARSAAAQQFLTFNSGVNLIQADQQIYLDAYKYNDFYNSILADATPLKTAFPSSNQLSPGLETIATMIQLRSRIGARRQIFLVDCGSFDTHAAQTSVQADLFAQVDQAVSIFMSAMQELGVYNDVTLFTASDFARTLQYNGSLGTDHAWGGHHFVVGGAVKGGKMYGKFPNMELNGPDDIDGSGRWAPTTALSQYAATLASWFGVPSGDLPLILPGLSNFSTVNLGFV
jgi:uncharacterized protein (DUF1501 family)